jgi:muramidase (phage lysozyme)
MDKRKRQRKRFRAICIAIGFILSIGLILKLSQPQSSSLPSQIESPAAETKQISPLVMTGGDPYIRALMRMISMSESNDPQPYSLIYGGTHFENLRRHPAQCVRIVNGPNVDNCSTAAGRYQTIDITWARLAKRYHPQADCVLFVFQCDYSFEAQYQDQVVHAWLSDPQAWGMDIPGLLKDDQLEKVRKRLSSTWTSLGYGIENNSMTPKLAGLYQQLLAEELGQKN